MLDLRLSVVYVHIFCFSFSEEKICWRKKQSVQDLIPPPSIYIHMCTLYTYTNICVPRFSLWALQVSPDPDSWAHIQYPICAVCVYVCVYTHVHPHTLPPALNIEKTQTTLLSFATRHYLYALPRCGAPTHLLPCSLSVRVVLIILSVPVSSRHWVKCAGLWSDSKMVQVRS